jgi:TolB-like protein/DNA-binding winged helix-turn-helix (wHTH) protein/Tfp pilus assembly protein PilF
MAVQVRKKYLLGEFELEPEKYLLKHAEEQIHLPELPFQVLLYLVENRERYVSRQELLDHFWAGSDAYEETLTKCISTIRTELNDPPVSPTYIETRKKVGYRYIGPFQAVQANSPAIAPVIAPSITSPENIASLSHIEEVETTRGVRILIEEDDDQPLVSPALPAQLVTHIHGSTWRKHLLLAAAILAIVVAAAAYSRWASRSSTNATAPINSIAVLPLRNLTGDPANDYFSDGMTESLISSLAKIENLHVQSRGSVFRFKNNDLDPGEIGKQLGVGAVLEGSVRNFGDSVRVAVRLVSVADGRVLWVSDSQDRAIGDVFALQDEIGRNVASGLKLHLSGEAEQKLVRRYTENVEAYQLYLQGRFQWNNYSTQQELQRAVQYFEAAIAKDPNYALAYAGLADSYVTLATEWRPPKEIMPKALAFAGKALEIDDKLGEAHFSRGAIAYFYEWDWAKAQKELERSLELDAKSLEANVCYLHSLEPSGNPDAAFAHVKRALDQNPLSSVIRGELSCAAYYAHRYDQAVDLGREALRMDQSSLFAHYNTARALGQKQMYEQAITELNKVMSVWGRSPMVLSELGFNYAASGRKAEARKLLDELQQRSAREYIDPYPLAFIHVALGKNDKALASLEKAYDARSTWMPWLKVEPKFDPLRSDPRFMDLLKRLKLE